MRLTKDFKKKLSTTAKRLASPEVKKKVGYFLDPHEELLRVAEPTSEHAIASKFVPMTTSPATLARKSFGRSVGKNYFDDQLKENQPRMENELHFTIQNEISRMTDKLVLVTQEHRKVVQKYLKLCQKEQVVPLPILNRLELGDSLRVLSLEDYTVNDGQAKCLGECLGRFGPGAFTKIYLYNNGLKDRPLAAIFEGASRNQHISSLEVAMNQM